MSLTISGALRRERGAGLRYFDTQVKETRRNYEVKNFTASSRSNVVRRLGAIDRANTPTTNQQETPSVPTRGHRHAGWTQQLPDRRIFRRKPITISECWRDVRG